MHSTYQSKLSLYTNIIEYIRQLRDEPNSLDGVRFAGYTDNADEEYFVNIQKYFLSKRIKQELPPELGPLSSVGNKYSFTPRLQVRYKKLFGGEYYTKDNYIVARALAYITSGEKGVVVNKEMYLLRFFGAIRDYEKEFKKKLSAEEKAIYLQTTNYFMGLESYIFSSNGTYYVMMESEFNGPTGLKQKGYTIVNTGGFANAVFKDDTSERSKYRFVSQIDLEVDEAQRFVDGELVWVNNFSASDAKNEIYRAKQLILGKFVSLKEDNIPRIQFEDTYGNSTPNTFANDYCFSVTSPVKAMTR